MSEERRYEGSHLHFDFHLPSGYRLEFDRDTLILKRPDGAVVDRFGSYSLNPDGIRLAAEEDDRGRSQEEGRP